MGYGDEQLRDIITEIGTTGPYGFHLMYKHKKLIINALEDVLVTRKELRKAIKDEIKANRIAMIDCSVIDEDELTHTEG